MEGIEGLEGESDNREAVTKDETVLIIALELLPSNNLISLSTIIQLALSPSSSSLAAILIN